MGLRCEILPKYVYVHCSWVYNSSASFCLISHSRLCFGGFSETKGPLKYVFKEKFNSSPFPIRQNDYSQETLKRCFLFYKEYIVRRVLILYQGSVQQERESVSSVGPDVNATRLPPYCVTSASHLRHCTSVASEMRIAVASI